MYDSRPSIDEYDLGSYLSGFICVFDVESPPNAVIEVSPEPSYEYEAVNIQPHLCQEHAFDLVRGLGFQGPVDLAVNSAGFVDEDAPFMVLMRDGVVVQVAEYLYGRCCFEPGEPRTEPCAVCGVETLIDVMKN